MRELCSLSSTPLLGGAGLWGSTCTSAVRLPPSVVAEPLEELPGCPCSRPLETPSAWEAHTRGWQTRSTLSCPPAQLRDQKPRGRVPAGD